MDKAKAAGAGILRVDVGWASIEQEAKGNYNQWYLKRLDAVVDKAEARGLKLLLTFWETPCWASTAPESSKQDCAGDWWGREVQRWAPATRTTTREALSFVVSRYRGRGCGLGDLERAEPRPLLQGRRRRRRYAQMVRAGYRGQGGRPRRDDPRGLAGRRRLRVHALAARSRRGRPLRRLVGAPTAATAPIDPGPDQWIQNSFVRGVPKVRETLLAAGEDKPIWLTEFGWSTCTCREGPSYANCVSFERQADYLVEAFNKMRSWSYVPVGIWFNIIDTSDAPATGWRTTACCASTGPEKPAYGAFARMSSEVAGGPLPEQPANAATTQDSASGTTERSASRAACP